MLFPALAYLVYLSSGIEFCKVQQFLTDLTIFCFVDMHLGKKSAQKEANSAVNPIEIATALSPIAVLTAAKRALTEN